MTEKTVSNVRTRGEISDNLEINIKYMQGNPLSMLLFNFVLDGEVKGIEKGI